jgi:hypothetical protein
VLEAAFEKNPAEFQRLADFQDGHAEVEARPPLRCGCRRGRSPNQRRVQARLEEPEQADEEEGERPLPKMVALRVRVLSPQPQWLMIREVAVWT